MGDLSVALRRPFTSIPRLILGIALSAIPVLNFVAIGYLLRCALQSEDKLPLWHHPVRLGWEGLQASAIGIIYALPVLVIVAMTALVGAPGSLLAKSLTLIIAVMLAITIYVAPAALLNFASDGWRAAFDITRAARLFWNKLYFMTWLKALVIGLVIGFVAILFITAIPFAYVVNIFYAAGLFIAQIIFWTLLGNIRGFSNPRTVAK